MLVQAAFFTWLAEATIAAPQCVAVFPPLARGKVEKSDVPRAENAVISSLRRLSVTTKAGAKLQKALKTNPANALAKCGADLRCVARLGRLGRLGRLAKADEVSLTEVVNGATGLELRFIALAAPGRG